MDGFEQLRFELGHQLALAHFDTNDILTDDNFAT